MSRIPPVALRLATTANSQGLRTGQQEQWNDAQLLRGSRGVRGDRIEGHHNGRPGGCRLNLRKAGSGNCKCDRQRGPQLVRASSPETLDHRLLKDIRKNGRRHLRAAHLTSSCKGRSDPRALRTVQ